MVSFKVFLRAVSKACDITSESSQEGGLCGLLFREGAVDKNPKPEERRKAKVGSRSACGLQLAASFAALGSSFG